MWDPWETMSNSMEKFAIQALNIIFSTGIERKTKGVNPARKLKNLFFWLIIIIIWFHVYRLENRKIEVCRVSGGGGTHWGLGPPGSVKFHK